MQSLIRCPITRYSTINLSNPLFIFDFWKLDSFLAQLTELLLLLLPIQDCRSCNLPPLFLIKRRNEYLRFPFKVKVDYFILEAILVSSFVIFFLFFAMNKRRRTHEALGCWISAVCKEVSKHPHILPIFKVVSEHLSFPLKLKVHHLIFYPGLRFRLRNFSSVFCYEQKKMHVRSREQKWKTDPV